MAVTITHGLLAVSGGTAGYSAANLAQGRLRPCITNWRAAWPNVEAHITGTVWKIEVAIGDSVDEGDTVVILESMKMEMPVEAEDAGTVKEIQWRRARPSARATRWWYLNKYRVPIFCKQKNRVW